MPDCLSLASSWRSPFCLLVVALLAVPPPAVTAAQPDQQALEQLMQQAGQMPAMDPAQMEALAGKAEALQRCMANIDPAALQTMEQQGNAFRVRVQTLCADGDRDAAAAEAMRYGQEVSQSDVMREMAGCGEHIASMMPGLAALTEPGMHEAMGVHVCDAP